MASKRTIDVAKDGYETLEIDGKTVRSTRVQNTDLYYKQNQLLRNNIQKSAVNKSWALPIASIPFADYQNAVKKNPALNSLDAQERTREWLKFLRSSIGEPLRTVNKKLLPSDMRPHLGSIILPSRVQKQLHKEQKDELD
jgi:hypothetical protein